MTKQIKLALIVSLCLAALGLNAVFAELNLSPGHMRLINLLRNQNTQAQPDLVQSGYRDLEEPSGQVQDTTGKNTTPALKSRRVYRELGAEEREALLNGLAQQIRTMQVGDPARDAAALIAYRQLLGQEDGKTTLAGDDGISIPGNAVAEVEPNDDWASAQRLTVGDTLAGTAIPFNDYDVYSFEGKAGQYVRVEAQPVDQEELYYGAYAIVSLYDPDSVQIFGGYYYLYENYDSRLIWPGGSLVASSLERDGTYYVVVEMVPGYIRWLDSGMPALNDIPEQEEEVTYRLTLDQLETTAVEGVVSDDRGSPISGATVQLWSEESIGGATLVTGGDGKFSTKLPEGAWGASIEGPFGSPYPSGQPQEMFKVYGEFVSVQFELARGVVFSGRIETNRGEFAAYVGMSLVGRDYNQYRWGESDEDGYFSIAVFPDTFTVYLHPGYVYPPQSMIENLVITSDTVYPIVLDSGNKISGRLLDGSGKPVADTWINFTNEMVSRSIYTSSEGGYEIYMPSGQYWVDVQPYTELLIPAQVAGPYTVDSDQELDIQLRGGGQLSGTVFDDRGNPVAGAQVNIFSIVGLPEPGAKTDTIYGADGDIIYADGSTDGDYPDIVDPNTGIVIDSRGYLPSYFYAYTNEQGQWRIALLAGQYGLDISSPYPYPSQRTKLGEIYLNEGDDISTGQVTFAYGVQFSGKVTVNGQPLAWSSFEMTTAYNDSIRYLDGQGIMAPEYVDLWVSTDDKGEFSIQTTPGTFDLLFNSGYGSLAYPRQYVRGVTVMSDTRMDIALEPGQTISGRVLTDSDWGLADCRLDFYAETGAWQGYTYSSDGGEFSMVLASGNYNMIVTAAKGYFADSAYYAVSVPGSDVRVVARQGVRVYGTVSASDGHPLGGVTIQLLPQITIQQSSTRLAAGKPVASLVSYLAGSDDDPVVDSGLIYEPYPMPLERGANVTRSDYDGNWELIVKPGVYDVYATPSLYGYVNSFLPSVDCTSERRVNLVIEQGEIVFEGQVKDADGREVPGTLVSLFDPENGGQISVFTDATGRFRLDVPMGEYEMFIEGPNGSGELPTSDRLQLDSDRQVLIQLGHGLLDSDNPGPSLPRAFALGQNVPNPFNPSTTISYALDEQARVKLAVYDVRGRTVAILVDKVQDEGDYDIQWDGKDTNGRRLASGIYIYRLQAGSHQQTRKMVLIK